MRPCSKCFNNNWHFQKIEDVIRANCNICGYEVEFAAKKRFKSTNRVSNVIVDPNFNFKNTWIKRWDNGDMKIMKGDGPKQPELIEKRDLTTEYKKKRGDKKRIKEERKKLWGVT